MNDHVNFESTDLGDDACGKFLDWIRGYESGRCLAVWVSDKFEKSLRTRGRISDEKEPMVLDILSGGIVSEISHIQADYLRFFKDGPEILYLKAKAVLLGPNESPVSFSKISRVNANFRRLSLETHCYGTTNDENNTTDTLKSLHIYLEIIKAFVSSSSRDILIAPPLPRNKVVINEADIIYRELHASISTPLSSTSFKSESMEEEKQPVTLNQYVVRESRYALLIDNAIPPLRMVKEYVR
jgi:hypothetical protein